jgi:hypothetical protein
VLLPITSKLNADIYIFTFDASGKNIGRKFTHEQNTTYGNTIAIAHDGRLVFTGYIV